MMQRVVLLLFGMIYICQGLPDPVGYYPLVSSTAANDSSSFKNPPGAIDNAQLSAGVYGESGGSYLFSGSRSSPSYIRLPTSNVLDTRYSITLLAWVYPQGTGGEIISYWGIPTMVSASRLKILALCFTCIHVTNPPNTLYRVTRSCCTTNGTISRAHITTQLELQYFLWTEFKWHPRFRNFDFLIPVDIVRVKSYVDSLFYPTVYQGGSQSRSTADNDRSCGHALKRLKSEYERNNEDRVPPITADHHGDS